MNCKLCVASVPAIALAASVLGATSEFYVNDAQVNCPPQVPPQVDAINFVNNSLFSVNFTNVLYATGQPYRTANTLNYTNNAVMMANTGYEFSTRGAGNGQARMADNFVNRGTIACGSVLNPNSTVVIGGFFFAPSLSRYLISATNVFLNSSTNIVGVDGLFAVNGKNVNLNRANVVLEGFDSTGNNTLFTSAGIFDYYWGVGTNTMSPAFQFEISPPQTPFHRVDSRAGVMFQVLSLPAAVAYIEEQYVGTNRYVQAVFLSDTNASISENVYFPFRGESVVEWQAIHTNFFTGLTTTNYLYLLDDFGSWGTNILVQNNTAASGSPTYIPRNYTFYRGGPFQFGAAAQPSVATGVFNTARVTNDYAAYAATFAPTTQLPGNLPGLTISNLPGRVEIVAEDTLDLTRARITGANYLRLRATNHFIGSTRAELAVPTSDISLATTNGHLVVTNLITPVVPRFTGEVDLWSGRWTNSDAFYSSTYSVLFVDSRLSPTGPTQVQDLFLKSTNVVISDVLNVARSCLIDAESLTITTNQPSAITPTGELNLLASQITWPSILPRLKYLTNSGSIRTMNAAFFGGSRTTQFYSSNYNEPYQALVNAGNVTTEGSLIWADYFENSGLLSSGFGYGSIGLQAREALLTNGTFLALNGDISITSGNLTVTNHALYTGRKLTLAVTGLLTDLGTSNVNSWAVGQGFNLPVRPAAGDLLGTTITETALQGSENAHTWAGMDRGASTAGFANNTAIGRLILDGGVDSLFTFTGASASNALYVDYLELRGYTTNKDSLGNLAGLQIDPNMKIYFGQAIINGVSQAEKLNGRHEGRLVWVPTYAGTYSSTPVVYQDGTTNRLNAALVGSENLDSDNDGVPNVFDPEPVFVPSQCRLTVALTNAPAKSLVLQWQTIGGVTNAVYVTTDPAAANWQVATSFVSAPVVGPPAPVQVTLPVGSGNRFYRVRVDTETPQ